MPHLHTGKRPFPPSACSQLVQRMQLAVHCLFHCDSVQLIQKTNIKAVHVLSGTADLQLVLAGQSPQVALEVAHNAIQFCERCWPIEGTHA